MTRLTRKGPRGFCLTSLVIKEWERFMNAYETKMKAGWDPEGKRDDGKRHLRKKEGMMSRPMGLRVQKVKGREGVRKKTHLQGRHESTIVKLLFFIQKSVWNTIIVCACISCSVLSDYLRLRGLTMGFSRQEYWSGFPFPSSGDLPNLGIELASLTSPELAGGFFTTSATWESLLGMMCKIR